MADSIYTFDPTAASNTALDSIAYGPNQLYHSNIDNLFRAFAAKLAQVVDDLGAVNTVGGTGDAITVTIASGITAYATGQFFRFVAGAANTGATTINVNSIGVKKVRKISGGSDVALAAGDIAAGETYLVVYRASADSAAGAFVIVGAAAVAAATTSAAGIAELATQTEAATLTDTSRALTADGLFFLGGYTTTATAAGTTTLTVTSTYNQYFTGSTTQTLVLPVTSTLVLGRSFRVVNNSTGAVTVQSSGANAILVLAAGASAVFTVILTSGTDAASWSYRPLGATLGTVVASTSGTSIAFTGIPAWAKRIKMTLSGVSTSGTSAMIVQLGSGSATTSGYLGANSNLSTVVATSNFTNGLGLQTSSGATVVIQGVVICDLLDPSTNTWAMASKMGRSDAAVTNVGASAVSLAGVLDRIILTTSGGSDTFDLGKVNISWE